MMKTFRMSAFVGALLLAQAAHAQDAKQIVQQAVNDQLAADRSDTSHWRYVVTESDHSKFVVVETENGAMRRHIDVAGQPASPQVLAQDDADNQHFIHDSSLRAKQRQNSAHDDKSSIELLNLMPEAFLWTVESQTPELTTLSYKPNPNFNPPDMESRVMGNMSGTLVVTNPRHRIKTFKGRLVSDVTIGFGLLARIKAGSTFDIERSEVAPGYWQITQTHVHIGGHALFFKTIGTQEDSVKSDFTAVPHGTTLEQGLEMLKEPASCCGGGSATRRR
ncbi:MAG TPA: hypothetical protein VGU46_10385 [Acidobacteriaceae bacterium]|nr:hypothetical protein [Acidobacteriaceae bacterium]